MMLDRWLPAQPLRGKIARFACVGFGATTVHFLVAIGLVSLLRVPPQIANASAVLVATMVSYVGNTLWSFDAAVGPRTLSRFLVVTTLIALLAALVSSVFEVMGWDYRLGIVATVVSIPPVTFWLHHAWTYRGG